jgi:hypothetical protein
MSISWTEQERKGQRHGKHRFTRSDDRLYVPVGAHAKHAIGGICCLESDSLLSSSPQISDGSLDALNS